MTTLNLSRRSLGAAALALALPSLAQAARRVRIGYQKNGSLVIVRQQRLLEPLGLAVEWVEFTSGPPLLEALNFAIAELEPTTRVLTTAKGVTPSNSFFLASRSFTEREPGTVLALLDAVNAAAGWAQANPEALAQTLADVTGVPLPAQRVAAPRGVYAVQPMNEAIIAQQQAIADTFAALRVIPARVDVRAAVWRPERQRAEARP